MTEPQLLHDPTSTVCRRGIREKRRRGEKEKGRRGEGKKGRRGRRGEAEKGRRGEGEKSRGTEELGARRREGSEREHEGERGCK